MWLAWIVGRADRPANWMRCASCCNEPRRRTSHCLKWVEPSNLPLFHDLSHLFLNVIYVFWLGNSNKKIEKKSTFYLCRKLLLLNGIAMIFKCSNFLPKLKVDFFSLFFCLSFQAKIHMTFWETNDWDNETMGDLKAQLTWGNEMFFEVHCSTRRISSNWQVYQRDQRFTKATWHRA